MDGGGGMEGEIRTPSPKFGDATVPPFPSNAPADTILATGLRLFTESTNVSNDSGQNLQLLQGELYSS
jgi:hypothetical protein